MSPYSQEQDNVEQNSFDLQLKCLFETLKKKQAHTKDVTSKLGIEKGKSSKSIRAEK